MNVGKKEMQGSRSLTVGFPPSTNAGLLQGEDRTLGRRGRSARAKARAEASLGPGTEDDCLTSACAPGSALYQRWVALEMSAA